MDRKLFKEKAVEYSLGVFEFCSLYGAQDGFEAEREDSMLREVVSYLGKIVGYSSDTICAYAAQLGEDFRQELSRVLAGAVARSVCLWENMIQDAEYEDIDRMQKLEADARWLLEHGPATM